MTTVTRAQLAAALLRRPLLKAESTEDRYVLGVAHPAGWRDSIGKGLDGHKDWMSAEAVEKAAWGFTAEGRQIGVNHADGTVGAATVVESYVWRFPDTVVTDTLGNSQTIRKGDWLVGAILSPDSWAAYKRGELTGWSVQGSGIRRARR